MVAMLFTQVIVISPSFGKGPASPKKKKKTTFESYDSARGIKVASFNAGLAYGFVPYAEERREKLANSLNSLDADVICLQEVWQDRDSKLIKEVLGDKYPYGITAPIKQHRYGGAGPSCWAWDLFGSGKYASCMLTSCSGMSDDEETACLIKTCRPALDRLAADKPECAEPLMASVGKNQITSILRLLNIFKKAGRFAYDGGVGTMILSKYSIDEGNSAFMSFSDFGKVNHRGMLYATINTGGKKRVVGCTHVTANLSSSAPYPGNSPYKGNRSFKNKWASGNFYESEILIREMNRLAGNGPQYLTGDFNCSFENLNVGVHSDFPQSCDNYIKSGYLGPVHTQNPECTFCKSNTLIENDTKEENLLLDHVFVKNDGDMNMMESSFILKNKINISADGKNIESSISDHYGVQVDISH